MKVNEFFRTRLNAPFYHPRMSWGAIDKKTGNVFLRVGHWSLDHKKSKNMRATIAQPDWDGDFGQKERMSQIDEIKGGADGYIVVVGYDKNGKLGIVNEDMIFKIDRIIEKDGFVYAEVVYAYPVDDIFPNIKPANVIGDDLEVVARTVKSKTTKKRLIDARIGQGQFRTDVLKLWGFKCAITKSVTVRAIRASHIKSWSESNNRERLDPYNGIPLLATIDALFDAGLISFKNDGGIIISPLIDSAETKRLSIHKRMKLSRVPRKSLKYLRKHRELHFE